jgi:hypothetical protein
VRMLGGIALGAAGGTLGAFAGSYIHGLFTSHGGSHHGAPRTGARPKPTHSPEPRHTPAPKPQTPKVPLAPTTKPPTFPASAGARVTVVHGGGLEQLIYDRAHAEGFRSFDGGDAHRVFLQVRPEVHSNFLTPVDPGVDEVVHGNDLWIGAPGRATWAPGVQKLLDSAIQQQAA